MFFLPSNPKDLKSRRILEWKTAQRKLPWGAILLVGGGFALADGTERSGLSKLLGTKLCVLAAIPPRALVAVLCFTTAMITEILANTTVATIFIPVFNQMAVSININPLFLLLPITVACSYAFMLPVATPPNIIAFESGNMRITDMAKPGLVMNLLCCAVQVLMVNTLGVAMFDLNRFPSWANVTANESLCSSFTEASERVMRLNYAIQLLNTDNLMT
ncbi:solute carrier family 13 member 5-like [Stegodyphus dumicola]|uniref:solute carrier family 13 member 5-like n=1 Tax=Stegodyphus dumicola TaxID=202533 RepID=UPI0015A8DD09|nr:solute carrier family 13 member 5-like [Stegodyphus dumicola]